MSLLFARVELRGKPEESTYEKLHAFMLTKNWYQHLPSNPDKPMPHAMYQATFTLDKPNLLDVAKALKSGIHSGVWPKAIVLVIRSADWAQSAD